MKGTLQELAAQLRPPKGALAVAHVGARGSTETFAPGRARHGHFEIGSLVKTMTATLLADLVLEGRLALHTTAGEILGARSGGASSVTMLELATHTSGSPTLAPNARSMPWYPRDPYRFYGERKLWAGLRAVQLRDRGSFSYSNIGYVLLARCLAEAAGGRFSELLTERVLRPAGLPGARAQPCSRRGLVPGHGSVLLGGRRWHEPLGGPGGVDATIDDLAAWLRANVDPGSTPIGAAVQLAQQIHVNVGNRRLGLAWVVVPGDLHWHNGSTGRYHASMAFRAGDEGVIAIASHAAGPGFTLDRPLVTALRGESA